MDDILAVDILSALAQPTRFKVFRMLVKTAGKDMAAGEIARSLEVPQNTLSVHLNIMSNAGLITSRKEGRKIFYSVQIEQTREFLDYLVIDCCENNSELCAFPTDALDCCDASKSATGPENS